MYKQSRVTANIQRYKKGMCIQQIPIQMQYDPIKLRLAHKSNVTLPLLVDSGQAYIHTYIHTYVHIWLAVCD